MFVTMSRLAAILMIISAGFARAADEPERVTKVAEAEVGQLLPALEGVDEAGQPWKSADHIGKKVLVLYFYPGDFTGGCTAQAQKYRDALAKIEELGAEVVGVSGDEAATHRLFKQTYGLTHRLLADPNGELAQLVGVPVKAGGKVRATGPDRRPLLDANGQRIDLLRGVTLARWTLVVDRDGKIAFLRSVVNPVTDAEEVRKIVAALP
jgi:thioredoxin-dependent peroxiredoxin